MSEVRIDVSSEQNQDTKSPGSTEADAAATGALTVEQLEGVSGGRHHHHHHHHRYYARELRYYPYR